MAKITKNRRKANVEESKALEIKAKSSIGVDCKCVDVQDLKSFGNTGNKIYHCSKHGKVFSR